MTKLVHKNGFFVDYDSAGEIIRSPEKVNLHQQPADFLFSEDREMKKWRFKRDKIGWYVGYSYNGKINKKRGKFKKCLNCGKEFFALTKRHLFCSIKCSKIGSRNPMWKGNNAGLDTIHMWVRRRKPKSILCEKCQKGKPYDLANISGLYKRDVNDYKWLCRRCHMEKDGRLENFIDRNKSKKTIYFILCEICGKKRWMVKSKLKKGHGIFCSNKCYFYWRKLRKWPKIKRGNKWTRNDVEIVTET